MDGHFKNEGDNKFVDVHKDNDPKNILFDIKNPSFSCANVFVVVRQV